MAANSGPSVTELFLSATTRRFREEYLPRIETAVSSLTEADLWWRPHPNTTSVGNLLLHLEGNVRQWILSGIGGAPDRRRRGTEFSTGGGFVRDELFQRLAATTEEACSVIEALDKKKLKSRYSVQGYDVTLLEGIYHVLEHFGWHTGQIVWIAKQRGGKKHGVVFYDDAKLND